MADPHTLFVVDKLMNVLGVIVGPILTSDNVPQGWEFFPREHPIAQRALAEAPKVGLKVRREEGQCLHS